MKLLNTNLLSLLPLFMRDDEANTALARAIDKLISEPGSRIQQLRVWDKIDEFDHGDLDELAWELNVDWYSTDMSLDAKRQTIKYAQQIQAKRGTKWAVEHLISAYFGRGYVREWFETGGDPFTFTVMTINAEISEQNFSGFIKAVNAAKSARSHLDGVICKTELPAANIEIHNKKGGIGTYRKITIDWDLFIQSKTKETDTGITPVLQVYQRTILN